MISTEDFLLPWFKSDVEHTSAYRKKKEKEKKKTTSKRSGFKTAGFFVTSVIKVSEKNTTSIIVADNSLQDEITVTKTSTKTGVPTLEENKQPTTGHKTWQVNYFIKR